MNTIRNLAAQLPLAACLVFALATTAAAAEPDQAKPAEATVAPAKTLSGARLWAQNCGRCHNAPDASEQRPDEWEPIMAHMRVRAGLTGADARAILTLLQEQ